MRTFRIVTLDCSGSVTQDILTTDMYDAIRTALHNLKCNDITSIRTVTCTIL